MHQALSTYYYFMKPSLAPSKVMDVFIKAAEYTEIPVRRTDNVPLQKLLMLVRSELNLDLKNIKQEQAKFWNTILSFCKILELNLVSFLLNVFIYNYWQPSL
ncbi:hypothetical protein M0R45_038283 [Rubus argutus]|uniref:Uncharacterized protein n=1 Tax=Rubus argutus TaxID=59490 RepID=A0AAW1W4T9_RUBAR